MLKRESDERRGQVVQSLYRVHEASSRSLYMLKRESDEKNLLDKGGQVVQSLDRVHVGQQQVPVHVKERVRREETCWPSEGR